MADIFPELAKLKGGKKEKWIRENRDLIVALNDQLGFDTTAEILYMKAGTLSRALVRAEGYHRPVITEANKAMNRAVLNENKINDVIKELNRHAEALDTHFAEDYQLREYLAQYFKLQAAAHTMMEQLMSNVSHTRGFTYHI